MIQINLLPVRVQKKQDQARQLLLAYLATVGILIFGIGYLWVSNEMEIDSLKGRVDRVKGEVAKYAKFEAALDQIKKKKELVDKKRQIITDLQKDRDTVVRMLALLSVQVPPEKVWLEKLLQTGNTMTLDGVALSNEAIVEFMRNLESSPYIEKGTINLVHSKQSTIKDMKLREFQVTYKFYPFSEAQKKMKM
ncbi:MAG: PilN domain-containing protein [Syntrophobacter sp.]